jgi:hypothetical protein
MIQVLLNTKNMLYMSKNVTYKFSWLLVLALSGMVATALLAMEHLKFVNSSG